MELCAIEQALENGDPPPEGKGGRPRAGGAARPAGPERPPGPGRSHAPQGPTPPRPRPGRTGPGCDCTRGPGLDAAGQVVHTEPRPATRVLRGRPPALPRLRVRPPLKVPPESPLTAPGDPWGTSTPDPHPRSPQRRLFRAGRSPAPQSPPSSPHHSRGCHHPHGPVVTSTPSRADRGLLPSALTGSSRTPTRNRPSQRESRGLTGQQAAALRRGCTRG